MLCSWHRFYTFFVSTNKNVPLRTSVIFARPKIIMSSSQFAKFDPNRCGPLSELTCPSTGSICCNVARTNTAVLPMPDLAWHRMSMPRMAWGMHSCWTENRNIKKITNPFENQREKKYFGCIFIEKYVPWMTMQVQTNKLSQNFHTHKTLGCVISTMLSSSKMYESLDLPPHLTETARKKLISKNKRNHLCNHPGYVRFYLGDLDPILH